MIHNKVKKKFHINSYLCLLLPVHSLSRIYFCLYLTWEKLSLLVISISCPGCLSWPFVARWTPPRKYIFILGECWESKALRGHSGWKAFPCKVYWFRRRGWLCTFLTMMQCLSLTMNVLPIYVWTELVQYCPADERGFRFP